MTQCTMVFFGGFPGHVHIGFLNSNKPTFFSTFRLNGLFWFFVLKTTYVMYDRYNVPMYQFVTSCIN